MGPNKLCKIQTSHALYQARTCLHSQPISYSSREKCKLYAVEVGVAGDSARSTVVILMIFGHFVDIQSRDWLISYYLSVRECTVCEIRQFWSRSSDTQLCLKADKHFHLGLKPSATPRGTTVRMTADNLVLEYLIRRQVQLLLTADYHNITQCEDFLENSSLHYSR